MAIQQDAIADLANLTLAELGESKLTDLATELQDYPAVRRMIPENKIAVQGGTDIQFRVITDGDGNFQWTGMFSVDDIDHKDATTYGKIPWRGCKTGMEFDIDEPAINQGKRQIVDFIKAKRYQRDIDHVAGLEAGFWMGNSTGSTDAVTMYGMLGYWLDYDASTGFNGGNHTNWSSGCAAISASTYPQWSHYTANYTTANDADLGDKLRKAVRYTKFRGIPNKPIQDYSGGEHKYGIYTTADSLFGLEDAARSQNDNLGANMAMYQDQVVVGRVPVEWVPYLESNHATSDPVIGIDWGSVQICALSGRWNQETPFEKAPLQNTVRVSHLDSRFNLVMKNRRSSFLIAKSDPLSD